MKKDFEFYARRSNLTKLWRVVARPMGEVIGSDQFLGEVRAAAGLTCRQIEGMGKQLRSLLVDHLENGDSVVLFDVVKVSPHVSPRVTEVNSKDAVMAQIRDLRNVPMGVTLHVTPRTTFSRLVKNAILHK